MLPLRYPTTGLQDLGGPLPGANVWSTTPDGIPDVGTISVLQSGPRDGDQYNVRADQVFRGGQDRLRANVLPVQPQTELPVHPAPTSITRTRSATR